VFEPYESPAGAGAHSALRRTRFGAKRCAEGFEGAALDEQPDGFDCPGCAWPDPKHTSSFEFCENGAKAVSFELTKRKVTREFFSVYSVRELEQQSDYWLEEQGRLTEPMRYNSATDHYEPISWKMPLP